VWVRVHMCVFFLSLPAFKVKICCCWLVFFASTHFFFCYGAYQWRNMQYTCRCFVIALRPQTPKRIRGGWSHYTDTSEPVDGGVGTLQLWTIRTILSVNFWSAVRASNRLRHRPGPVYILVYILVDSYVICSLWAHVSSCTYSSALLTFFSPFVCERAIFLSNTTLAR
jgi:hypothetical protein